MAPLDGIEAEHRELLAALAVGVLIALVVAGVGGWVVARQSLRPLTDLAAQAALITERDPSGRLQTPHTTTNWVAWRGPSMRCSIGSRRRFTANGSSWPMPRTNCERRCPWSARPPR